MDLARVRIQEMEKAGDFAKGKWCLLKRK